MPNDQFQIPEQYNESEIRAQISAIQLEVKPEFTPEPYRALKDIENDIDGMREHKMTHQTKSKNWLKGVVDIVFTPQAPTLEQLIERESYEGGKIFGPGSKFWLDKKQPNATHGDGHEWFFQQQNPATSKTPIVLRFQTTPHQIHKLYEGNEYPMTQEETQTFTEGVKLYKSAIAPLYFDQNDTV